MARWPGPGLINCNMIIMMEGVQQDSTANPKCFLQIRDSSHSAHAADMQKTHNRCWTGTSAEQQIGADVPTCPLWPQYRMTSAQNSRNPDRSCIGCSSRQCLHESPAKPHAKKPSRPATTRTAAVVQACPYGHPATSTTHRMLCCQ